MHNVTKKVYIYYLVTFLLKKKKKIILKFNM